ncbi:histidine kinase [Haladaptatus paucihalophilus DX253]|uniref:histidine kinase n=1 Tax=Haladaptatus paucihalophilus DX253 TaxID=797209 RepID=E7QZ67_HALPU|nr:HAMP domain-containing sensor histidine kinase [Haladaptatus paucihalophilus]EFW89988.1 histidine kinase [Haladaptatus paucihalophilus DX253]SHL01811.1 His Kinase A (phospho-acceptor) domain-containing protein [Haladaptatus paucihalophilus DX253]
MTDDDSDDGLQPLPVDGYPDPVLEYGFEDERPVVRAGNEAFRVTFDADASNVSLRSVFDRFQFSGTSSPTEFVTRVSRNEQFGTRLRVPERADADGGNGDGGNDGTSYLVRVVPASDGSGGHVVFAPGCERPRTKPGDERWGSVASVITHDLRNPLDVAKARLRAGRETGDDAHFEHVERAHERMERIIRDVLTASRGTDTIAVDPSEAVDFEELAVAAWETVETDGATLTVEDSLPTAVADADHVGRLFENLFRNAVEHGGETPTVRIGGLSRDSNDGFYVADDGPGIPPRDRQVVFEPGYSSHERGTGLGLAIVARIVAAHEWTIRIEESANGGARFEVCDVRRDDSTPRS